MMDGDIRRKTSEEALTDVVFEPDSLVQKYRQFAFMSPWEGAQYILPGAKKKAG